jgi:hypothetical protein
MSPSRGSWLVGIGLGSAVGLVFTAAWRAGMAPAGLEGGLQLVASLLFLITLPAGVMAALIGRASMPLGPTIAFMVTGIAWMILSVPYPVAVVYAIRRWRPAVLIVLAMSVAATVASAQDQRVAVTFAPQNKNPQFEAATDEYRAIWAAEGNRIIAAMEQISKLRFPEKKLKAEIYEGTSFSGRGGEPMRLRASYPAPVKKGTLVHELGHRMNAQLRKRPLDLDEHRLLFLYLYDLFENLYGKEFADREVAWEKTLKGRYDYDAAWTWALAMTRDERQAKLGEVLRANRK